MQYKRAVLSRVKCGQGNANACAVCACVSQATAGRSWQLGSRLGARHRPTAAGHKALLHAKNAGKMRERLVWCVPWCECSVMKKLRGSSELAREGSSNVERCERRQGGSGADGPHRRADGQAGSGWGLGECGMWWLWARSEEELLPYLSKKKQKQVTTKPSVGHHAVR